MSKTFTAVFAQTPKTNYAIAAAAMGLTGVGSVADTAPAGAVKLVTAGAEGAIVTKLTATPRVTNGATTAFLFLRRAADASTLLILIDSVVLPANSVTTTSKAVATPFTTVTEALPIRLGAGDELWVGLAIALTGGVTFYAEQSDF